MPDSLKRSLGGSYRRMSAAIGPEKRDWVRFARFLFQVYRFSFRLAAPSAIASIFVRSLPMRRIRAFTLVEILVVISIIALLIGILLPSLAGARKTASELRNTSNLRGIDQSAVIYGNGNNSNLPGLSTSSQILTGYAVSMGNNTTGGSFHSRLWILLNGQFLGGDLLISPNETLAKWTSGNSCTSANTSYAGLNLTDTAFVTGTGPNVGRLAEWKNNASGQAILMSDRLYVTGNNQDTSVQSIWTGAISDWRGSIVWGDNHAEFTKSNRGFITRYLAYQTTDDNLFVSSASAGITDATPNSTSNAFLIYF
jgi:prepilin-type N-terminal cleavage/methylation domain-containing protein